MDKHHSSLVNDTANVSNDHNSHNIGKLILKLRRMERQPRTFGEAGSLTPSEMHIIEAIGCGQGIFMSELAAKLGITKGAVTQIVGRLEEREFVKRHPHPNDSRSVVVSLEERGKTAFHVHEKLHEEFIHSLREELGEEGYLCFEKGIAKFISFLGK